MELKFKYSDVMDRCRMLSSFEGREYVSKSGESLYLEIKITEQDEPLILSYMEQAARSLQEMMARMVTGAEYAKEGFTWEIRGEETRWNAGNLFDRSVHEAIVSYVMMNWLSEKKSARAEMYKTFWEDMGTMCVRNVMRKMPPKKKRREPVKDVDEVEVFVKTEGEV